MSNMAVKYGLMKRAKKACPGESCPGCAMCKGGMMAEGGEVKEDDGSEGIVDRIMKRFAKGGAVEPVADFEENDFDVMDGGTEAGSDADYSGADSGDDIGDKAVSDEDDDVVSRVMRGRSKKDRMPRPA